MATFSTRRWLRSIEPLEERTLLAGTPTGEFAFSGGVRYFAADDGLYRATDSGETVRLAVLTSVTHLTDVAGMVYFAADDGVHGSELWRSDGTPVGTRLVTDINPEDANANPAHLTALDGVLLFSANDGAHGTELWRSDGTASGTILLTDFQADDYHVIYATSINFAINDEASASTPSINGIADADWWVNQVAATSDLYRNATGVKWDQTTLAFKALLSTSTQSAREHVDIQGPTYNMRGVPLATGETDLWDGSLQSRRIFSGIRFDEDVEFASGSRVWTGTLADGGSSGNTADDWTNNSSLATQGQLGSTDSKWVNNVDTNSGVARLYGVSPLIPGARFSSDPDNFVVLNHTLYFTVNDPSDGRELWKTDGTIAGTKLVAAYNADSQAYDLGNLVSAGGKLYFTTSGGIFNVELRELDPVTGASRTFSPPGFTSSLYFLPVVATNSLYFMRFLNNGGSRAIFKFDLQTGAIDQAAGVPFKTGDSGPMEFAALGNRLFFTDVSSQGPEFWTTNGTMTSAKRVETLLVSTPQTHLANPLHLTAVGDRIYFTADDGTHGVELWATDGTSEGTYLVHDINTQPGPGSSSPDNLVDVNGTLYFTADDGVRGRELWKLDLITGGPSLVEEITPTSAPTAFGNLIGVADALYFTVVDAGGTALWKSDGTEPGTFPLAAASGTISGRLWLDTNGNSQRDPGEAGIANEEVLLMTADWSTWHEVTTAADGTYAFQEVPQGVYRAFFATHPSEYEFVLPNRHETYTLGGDAIDSDADQYLSGVTGIYGLSKAETIDTVDAGMRTALEFPWQNPAGLFDVDDDGETSPRDILIIVEEMRHRANLNLAVPSSLDAPPFFFDVSGNGKIDPADVLLLVDRLRYPPADDQQLTSAPPTDPETGSNEIANQIAAGLAVAAVDETQPETTSRSEALSWIPISSTSAIWGA